MFYTVDDYGVKFSDDRTELIAAPHNLTGIYEVPKMVSKISSGAFRFCRDLEIVILPPQLQKLSDEVFYECKKLKSVVFNSDVDSIGRLCFAGCTSLSNITLPQSVMNIGMQAFCRCESIERIIIPENCILQERVFEFCRGLKEVNIPKLWTEIPEYTFHACESLENIEIPNNIIRICDSVFEECTSLYNIYLEDNVDFIGNQVFAKCSSLSKIRFGLHLQHIGEDCFRECYNLHTVFWDAIKCKDFSYIDPLFSWRVEPYLYNRQPLYNTKSDVPRDRWTICFLHTIQHIFIGNQVQHIPAYLCAGINTIEEIDIPNNVKTIGECAFAQCNPIYIYLNKHITPTVLENIFGLQELDDRCYIEDIKYSRNPFYYCDRIEEIHVSKSNPYYASIDGNLYDKSLSTLIKIGNKNKDYLQIDTKYIADFAGLNLEVKELYIKNCNRIGDFAFYNCQNLKSVSFDSTKNDIESECVGDELLIGFFAFGDCPNLTSIYWNVNGELNISNSYQIWGSIYGEKCTDRKLRKYDYSKQILEIRLGAHIDKLPKFLSRLLSVKDLFIPQNIKEINEGLPPNIETITIEPSSGITNNYFSFDNGCLLNKTGETFIRYIGRNEQLELPKNVKTIAKSAFSYSSIKSVILPESLETIEDSAFAFSNIESLEMPENLTSIGENAFKGCSKLKNIKLNNNISSIGNYAFANCISLLSFYIPTTTEIGFKILDGCSSITELKICHENLSIITLSSLKNVIWDCKGEKPIKSYLKSNYFGQFVTYDDGEIYRGTNHAHKIETIVLTDNVEVVPRGFADYTSIRNIEIPASVRFIGYRAFWNCPNLEKIILHSMDVEFEADFCHFRKTSIEIYNAEEACTPTSIFFNGEDVTEHFLKNNDSILKENIETRQKELAEHKAELAEQYYFEKDLERDSAYAMGYGEVYDEEYLRTHQDL